MAAFSQLLFQFGIALDVVVFIITVFITSMSYRLYRLFRKPRYRQFSIGFFFVSISYFIFALLNILSYSETYLQVLSNERLVTLLTQARMVTMLAGLLLFIYLYYEIHELGLQLLLASLVAAVLVLSGTQELGFFILSGILFFFIAVRLYRHYRSSPDRTGLFVLIGFVLLFTAKMLSAVLFLHGGAYAGYYLFKLTGVLVILGSLWVISR